MPQLPQGFSLTLSVNAALVQSALLLLALTLLATQALAAGQFWATADRVNRRTCPSTDCGIVGQLFFREGVAIHERKGGWARISKYYNASCRAGKSEYVDSGNASCTASNGIRNGQFAEWVSVSLLSEARPDDPGADAKGFDRLVSGSDDYQTYKSAFVKAAKDLIDSGQCSAIDFREMGGWVKSSNQKTRPIYFTYCGGMTRSNRIYLNAETGKTFR